MPKGPRRVPTCLGQVIKRVLSHGTRGSAFLIAAIAGIAVIDAIVGGHGRRLVAPLPRAENNRNSDRGDGGDGGDPGDSLN